MEQAKPTKSAESRAMDKVAASNAAPEVDMQKLKKDQPAAREEDARFVATRCCGVH
jgi:hypothetical protein